MHLEGKDVRNHHRDECEDLMGAQNIRRKTDKKGGNPSKGSRKINQRKRRLRELQQIHPE